MDSRRVRSIGLLVTGVLAAGAAAQTNIDPAHKVSWQENCGWMNWYDANTGSLGVRVHPTFLEGYIWCENIGWINVGDGTPGGGTSYGNATGADTGVNILPTNDLDGLGWGENVGWINFNTAVVGAQRARFDPVALRFRGYAWGENIGWINLDDGTSYVAVYCYANCDLSNIPPILNVLDFACFLNQFAAGSPYANCDLSTTPPVLNVLDFACFLNRFAAGCP